MAKTEILWSNWLAGVGGHNDEGLCTHELERLVKAAQKNPDAKFVTATDSEGDRFEVLANGDTSAAALTAAMDETQKNR